MMHVIPATLHLAAPATIRYLAIVTLSFSQPNMVDLLAMLDSGQIASLDFLYSVYFRSNNREACEGLTSELGRRGHRVYAGLIHAKILLIETTDGRHFVVEASANLRSCAHPWNKSRCFTTAVYLTSIARGCRSYYASAV